MLTYGSAGTRAGAHRADLRPGRRHEEPAAGAAAEQRVQPAEQLALLGGGRRNQQRLVGPLGAGGHHRLEGARARGPLLQAGGGGAGGRVAPGRARRRGGQRGSGREVGGRSLAVAKGQQPRASGRASRWAQPIIGHQGETRREAAPVGPLPAPVQSPERCIRAQSAASERQSAASERGASGLCWHSGLRDGSWRPSQHSLCTAAASAAELFPAALPFSARASVLAALGNMRHCCARGLCAAVAGERTPAAHHSARCGWYAAGVGVQLKHYLRGGAAI